jgi:hypothetical protein
MISSPRMEGLDNGLKRLPEHTRIRIEVFWTLTQEESAKLKEIRYAEERLEMLKPGKDYGSAIG